MLVEILFFVFAAILAIAALGMILVRNPVHAALLLVLCFFTSASIWLLIEAEFLAVVLILVYVGAVMVLFLFVVMMLDITVEQVRARMTKYVALGGIVAGVVVFQIVSVVWTRNLGLEVMEVVNLRSMLDVHGPKEGSLEEPLTVLADLQRQGLVRHIGLSNVTSKQVADGL